LHFWSEGIEYPPQRTESRYKLLQAVRLFSQVIKEYFTPPKTGGDLLSVLEDVRVSEGTLDSIEAQIRTRRENPARIVEL
jgi:hypothetical protein